MEAAYIMVYLWKQAVEQAGTADDSRQSSLPQPSDKNSMLPKGTVQMFPNHHISKTVRVGQVRDDGLFDIVWSTPGPVDPQPWNQFVPETKGFACDWTDPAKGSKFKMEKS
jgi:urea transport system substrate-binding protein